MNRICARSVCFVVLFVFAPLAAQAQGRGAGANLAARVDALEAAVAALQNSLNAEAAARAAADTTLGGRVDKLEGNITATDLVGMYAMAGIDIPMAGLVVSPPHNATIRTDGFTGTMTLNADGTASLVLAGCSVRLTQDSWALTDLGCSEETANGTWIYANGIVTTDIGQFNADFSVGVGGRLLTTAFAVFHPADPSSDTVILIGSRLQ